MHHRIYTLKETEKKASDIREVNGKILLLFSCLVRKHFKGNPIIDVFISHIAISSDTLLRNTKICQEGCNLTIEAEIIFVTICIAN